VLLCYCAVVINLTTFEIAEALIWEEEDGKIPQYLTGSKRGCFMTVGYLSGWGEVACGSPRLAAEIMCSARSDQELCTVLRSGPDSLAGMVHWTFCYNNNNTTTTTATTTTTPRHHHKEQQY